MKLTQEQAALLSKAFASAWDELPPTEEQEFGPKTAAQASQSLEQALNSADVLEAGIVFNEDERAALTERINVYLQAADTWGDLTQMEAKLAELFIAY